MLLLLFVCVDFDKRREFDQQIAILEYDSLAEIKEEEEEEEKLPRI